MPFGSVFPCKCVADDTEAHDCGPNCLCGGESHSAVAPYRSRSVFHTMTTDFTSDDEISSTEDFDAALGRVILGALQSDIDPRGTWEYRTDGPASDVEVMVVELAD